MVHLTVYQHFDFTLQAHFLGFVNDNLFFVSFHFFHFQANRCHIFHVTYEGNVIKEIFVVLRMDFFNENGPLSGLNVKQIRLLARYSILLI